MRRFFSSLFLIAGVVGVACGQPGTAATAETSTTSTTAAPYAVPETTTTTAESWYGSAYPEGSGGIAGEAYCQGTYRVDNCVYDRNQDRWIPS